MPKSTSSCSVLNLSYAREKTDHILNSWINIFSGAYLLRLKLSPIVSIFNFQFSIFNFGNFLFFGFYFSLSSLFVCTKQQKARAFDKPFCKSLFNFKIKRINTYFLFNSFTISFYRFGAFFCKKKLIPRLFLRHMGCLNLTSLIQS